MTVSASSANRALLLDLDGTLAVSVDILVQVYHRFLQARGRSGSPQEFARLNGPSLAEVVASLKRDHDLAGDVDVLLAEYRALVGEVYKDVEPNVGGRELIAAANALGWRVAVVTSNTRDIASKWLDRVGFNGHINALVTGELVSKGKPDPEIYLTALKACDTSANRALAVEDTPMGAASACGAAVETHVLTTSAVSGPSWPPGLRTITRLDDLIPVLEQRSRI